MDLISIIVPIYNAEQYIKRCVESIQRQTYTELEIILIDDGSPDRCGEICDSLAAEDERIKVIHKSNEGQGYARNDGLKLASGKYVAFIDADDYIDITHIEKLYYSIKENNADTAMGSLSYKKGRTEAIKRSLYLEDRVYEGNEVIDCILLSLIGPDVNCKRDVCVDASACINLYSKEIIDSNNVTFTNVKQAVSEDLFFNIRYFYYAKKVAVIKEYGYYYFENSGSETRKYDYEYYTRTFNFYVKMYEQIKEFKLQDRVGLRADRTFLLKIRFLIRLIVMSDLKRSQKKTEIKRVIYNPLTQAVLADYPTQNLAFAIRLLTGFMRKKNVLAVYFLTQGRLLAKNSKLLSKVLKVIGIGKN